MGANSARASAARTEGRKRQHTVPRAQTRGLFPRSPELTHVEYSLAALRMVAQVAHDRLLPRVTTGWVLADDWHAVVDTSTDHHLRYYESRIAYHEALEGRTLQVRVPVNVFGVAIKIVSSLRPSGAWERSEDTKHETAGYPAHNCLAYRFLSEIEKFRMAEIHLQASEMQSSQGAGDTASAGKKVEVAGGSTAKLSAHRVTEAGPHGRGGQLPVPD